MDRPVREKKRPNDYDPAKEVAKPQWKKPKSEKKKSVHTYFVSATKRSQSRLLLALRPVLACAQEPPAHNGPVHTYFADSD